MARDRQRAKQRRARQEGATPRPRKKKRNAGGELGEQLDGLNAGASEGLAPDAADPEFTGAGPGPDPLDQATPYADEAKFAESGAAIPSPTDAEGDVEFAEGVEGEAYEDDHDRAPDLLERDLAPASLAHAEAGHPGRRKRGRVITFLGHCVDELRRVQWPDRRHVGQGTAVTLGFVVLAGGYLGLMDALWKPLVEAIL